MSSDPGTVVGVADVLEVKHRKTIHTWQNPDSWTYLNGGAVRFPGSFGMHVEHGDQYWVKMHGGSEFRMSLPADALPARKGHVLALVGHEDVTIAAANLTTGDRYSFVETAEHARSRTSKWPVFAALIGGIAGLMVYENLPAKADVVPYGNLPDPALACRFLSEQTCQSFKGDVQLLTGTFSNGRVSRADQEAATWAKPKIEATVGVKDRHSQDEWHQILPILAAAPSIRNLSAAEQQQWRAATDARGRLLATNGSYQQEFYGKQGGFFRNYGRIVLAILALALPTILALALRFEAVKTAGRRDAVIDAALDEASRMAGSVQQPQAAIG